MALFHKNRISHIHLSTNASVSRMLDAHEILIAYNTSSTERQSDFVIVDSSTHNSGDTMMFFYGREGSVTIQRHPDAGNTALFVQLDLEPMQFVILE